MADTQTVDMKAVMEKIALMKELEARAGTPGEAAAAAGRIQALMFKYSISEMEVRQATRDESEGFEREDYNLGDKQSWKAHLLNSVATFNFCRMVHSTRPRGGNVAILVGRENNIIVTKNLYEFLVDELVRLADVAWKEAVREAKEFQLEYSFRSAPSLNARSYKHSFYFGAVNEIHDRLKRQHDESQSEYEGSSALVVVENDELDRALKEMFGRLRSGSRPSINDQRGYRSGVEAGKSVNLVDQIGG